MSAPVLLTLLAALATVGTLAVTATTAYAGGEDNDLPMACVKCNLEGGDVRMEANKMLLDAIPVSVWTDKADYTQEEMVMVNGKVANIVTGFAITITVTNPLNSIITVDQVDVMRDGSFATSINTAGPMWEYNGIYTISANYGSAARSNSVQIGLTDGSGDTIVADPGTPSMPGTPACDPDEIVIDGDQCMPFSISGGAVTGAAVNMDDNSIVISIDATDDGVLKATIPMSVQKGMFMVLVDGEEWDDSNIDGNMIKVMFPAGTEQIEIIGTWVVPEFGTVAVMILVVAIISIVAISARSRPGIMMPRC